jgi:hypothetical protein
MIPLSLFIKRKRARKIDIEKEEFNRVIILKQKSPQLPQFHPERVWDEMLMSKPKPEWVRTLRT